MIISIESLLKKFKRPIFYNIMNYIKNRQIILITGLRRVGKTTLIYQLVQDLLDNRVKETSILYFSFDEEKGGRHYHDCQPHFHI